MKYYHIQRVSPAVFKWEKGQIIETNKQASHNPYFEGILNSLRRASEMRENGESIMDYGYKFFVKNESEDRKHIKKFGLIGYQLAMQYQKWIREELFERVRLSTYPNLPSRKQSIWVTTEELVPYWNQQILRNPLNKGTRVLEVSIDSKSKTHKADQFFVEIHGLSIEDIEKRAHEYWKGTLSKTPRIEVLVEGLLEVKSVL